MAKKKFLSNLKDWLIGADEDEEDSDDYIDPIVENRRRESFERTQPKVQPKPATTTPVRKPVQQTQAPKTQPVSAPKPQTQKKPVAPKPVAKPKPAPKPKPKQESAKVERKDEYIMSEIISPMSGIKVPAEKQPEVKRKAAHKKKFKMNKDELIPVISPMFGPSEEEEPKKTAPKKTEPKQTVKEVKKPAPKKEKAPAPAVKKPQKPDEVINNVEDRLKNISSLAEETQDDLKIIEERTGKFKLDFKKDDDSLIDEIDDNMSLDELMNLYEKKFKE